MNRDPIAEKGGIGLYRFVDNDSISKTDFRGLRIIPYCYGKCGADVTKPFNATLKNIETAWNTHFSSDEKVNLCSALKDSKTRKGAWIIPKIADIGSCGDDGDCNWPFASPAKEGRGGCEGTVAYDGQCYQARDLHYKMWGKIMKLCNQIDPLIYNLETAILGVWVWKFVVNQEDDPQYFEGARIFTIDGYSGRRPKGAEQPLCSVDRNNYVKDSSFAWQWLPHHRLNITPHK